MAKAKSKAKKKTSTQYLDNPLFQHGEKFLFLLVIALVVWMITQGSSMEKFKLTPEQIDESARRATEHIKESKIKPVEFDAGVVVYDYKDFANLIKTAVKVNAYETPIRWEQSLFPDKVKRPEIIPLPVENLKAVASIGTIQYKDKPASPVANAAMPGAMGADPAAGMGMDMAMGGPGAGSNVKERGRRWITVTGSIPVRKQLAVYMQSFSGAQYSDSLRDQPKYLLYRLERGVMGETGEVSGWKAISLLEVMKKENNSWAGIGMEQVDLSYFAPLDPNYPPMAMSCPPMSNRMFGEEVANLPNIPVQSDEMMEQASSEMQERNKLLEKMQDVRTDDILKRSPFGAASTRGMGSIGMDGAPGADPSMAAGMGGPGMEGPMGGAGQSQSNTWMLNQNVGKTIDLDSNVAPVDYYLFRFFDFDVQPNQTYVYRVKLVLANPNYGVDENFVVEPKSTKSTFIESPFSEVSNPVSLGKVSRIYFQTIAEDERIGRDPNLLVSSVYYDVETGSESIVKDQKVVRGQVANFLKQNHKALESKKQSTFGMGPEMSMDPMMGAPGGGRGSKSKKKKEAGKIVDHISDVCVMDVFGGYKLPNSDLRSPSRALVLQANGLVQTRYLNEDKRELNRIEKETSGNANNAMGGMDPNMGGMF